MEVRHAVHPQHAKAMDTDQLREHFLVQDLFADEPKMVYTFYDRLLVAGVRPVKPARLEADPGVIGADFLLQRREMGVINIGGAGKVIVDGQTYPMSPRDGLFIGMGARDIEFASDDAAKPARFYILSAPAHTTYPTTHISFEQAQPVTLGEMENSNKRTIRKYIHPDGVKSCQLVMGMTTLETGCVWNTMPPHSHQRRMEAYIYFDMTGDNFVFHFMGEPGQTRHLVVREGEVVLSPSWSMHAGAGTGAYTFIWGMAGENQTFTDMDNIPMADLK
jgi:4-deoxy-L-threo-5-hexosulose-uronate ketol-isomerase